MSHLISKASLWEERDKAIEQKYEKLNNDVLPKVANDKQARFGAREATNFGMDIRSMFLWICSLG